MRDIVKTTAKKKPEAPASARSSAKPLRPRATAKTSAPKERAVSTTKDRVAEASLDHVMGFRLDADLHLTIQEALAAIHAAGDYSCTGMAMFIRLALTAYFDGELRLVATGSKRGSRRIRTTVNFSDSLYQRYLQLPRGKRNEIVERVARSYLKTKFITG